MLASPLPPSFIETYSLSTSSLVWNALCMVISFLALWSSCLSSSLVHLRKGPEYLTRGTAQVFIPLMRFLLESYYYYYYHYYYYYGLRDFLYQFKMVVIHFSLSASLFKTLLSILAVLSRAVVWRVTIILPISNSFNLFSWILGTVTRSLTTIGITDTPHLVFHSFFNSQAMSVYWTFRFLSFSFYGQLEWWNPLDDQFFSLLID